MRRARESVELASREYGDLPSGKLERLDWTLCLTLDQPIGGEDPLSPSARSEPARISAPRMTVWTVRLRRRSEGEGSAFSLLMKRGPRPIEFSRAPTTSNNPTRLAGKSVSYSNFQTVQTRLRELTQAAQFELG